jgi:hypothetical protein
MRVLLAALVAALSLSLAARANAATTTCATVAACIFGSNTSSGYGVEGSSKANDGVVGITTENATSAAKGKSGVSGYDNSTNKNTYNSGLYGVSVYGAGVNAKSTNGNAINAQSTNGTAVNAQTTNGIAVNAQTTNGSAVNAQTTNGFAILGNSLTAIGVYGVSTYGAAAEFAAGSPEKASVVLASAEGPPIGSAISAVANQREAIAVNIVSAGTGLFAQGDGQALALMTNIGGLILEGVNPYGSVVSIDAFGNQILSGSLTSNGTPTVRTRRSSGSDSRLLRSPYVKPDHRRFRQSHITPGSRIRCS